MKLMLSILTLCGAMALFAEEIHVDSSYFHPAASHYIHGDSTSASNLVSQGLSLFPEDGKLLRLKELLEQEQEQEKEQEKDKEQDQDQEKDQEKDQDKEQEKEQERDKEQEQGQDDPQQQQGPEPPSAEQMSQDEAESLLDAMKQEEKNKRLQLHPVMGAPVKVDKDW